MTVNKMLSRDVLLSFLLLLLFPSMGYSKIEFPARIPNGTNANVSCAACHNLSNMSLIQFGNDFKSANKVWTVALAGKDSDGDGRKNGQELGDPNGTWVQGQPDPGTPSEITNPGIANSFPSPTPTKAPATSTPSPIPTRTVTYTAIPTRTPTNTPEPLPTITATPVEVPATPTATQPVGPAPTWTATAIAALPTSTNTPEPVAPTATETSETVEPTETLEPTETAEPVEPTETPEPVEPTATKTAIPEESATPTPITQPTPVEGVFSCRVKTVFVRAFDGQKASYTDPMLAGDMYPLPIVWAHLVGSPRWWRADNPVIVDGSSNTLFIEEFSSGEVEEEEEEVDDKANKEDSLIEYRITFLILNSPSSDVDANGSIGASDLLMLQKDWKK